MRTILAVDSLGGFDPVTGEELMMVKADRAPIMVQEAMKYRSFKLSPNSLPAWETPNAVRERGRMLRQELRKHPGIATILDNLAHSPLDQVQPIYVKLSEGDAELINWETLCDDNDAFLALDQRWPIGRISDPMSGQSRPPAVLRKPVKVLAVISAYGVNGQKKEWEMFRQAAQVARDAGLDIRLRLLVGDEDTRSAVDAAIAEGLDWVEVSHIENTGARVIQDIIAWAPNVLHFFCHCSAGSTPSEQALELATTSDYLDPGASGGSVKIRARQLADMSLTLANPWLLTLNCCSSGQATKELQSIAHQVVSAGFPAAVAMLEPVDTRDAYEFTRAFYPALFADLLSAANVLVKQPLVPFEWTRSMYEARMAICDLHGGDAPNAPEWTLPVLYVRGVEPLQFASSPADVHEKADDFKLRARLVAEWLQTVREETSERRLAVIQSVLADVPKSYWPNIDGNFEHA